MKKIIYKTAQLGGKGTFRRKKRRKIKLKQKVITYHEQKINKIINQFNHFPIDEQNIHLFNNYCYQFIKQQLNTFTRKYFYNKNIIENKEHFIQDNLLLCLQNKKTKFILKYTVLKQYLSEKGLNALIDIYFELWDNLNMKKYLK